MDEIENRNALGSVARAYIGADDRLREENERLKPIRGEKRDSKERLVELMRDAGARNISLEDYRCSLSLKEGVRKRRPTQPEIQERAADWAFEKGLGQLAVNELVETLFKPIEEESLSLRRCNMK